MTTYHAFFHSTNRLSNWYPKGFIIGGVHFNCVEQWMMFIKAWLFGDVKVAAMVLAEADPYQQKKLGRQVRGFDKRVWDRHARDLVYVGKKAQFDQNPGMKGYLMSIDCDEFVEASMYDKIWGVGMSEYNPLIRDKKNWRGKNWLGEVVTRIRNEYREEGYVRMSMLDATIIDQQDHLEGAVIFDLTEEIDRFIERMAPDIDFRAYIVPVMQLVTNCIWNRGEAGDSLENTGESIRNNDALEMNVQDRVADAAIELGLALRDKLDAMNYYVDGNFPFHFAGFSGRAQAIFIPMDNDDPVGDVSFDAPLPILESLWPASDHNVY